MKALFLIGMPGAGKTYWAQKLAKYFSWEYLDLDMLIEEEFGMTIPHIFEQYGEERFREKEAACLKGLVNSLTAKQIVACGGGTPVFNNNMDFMLSNGCVVFLDTEMELLKKRILSQLPIRPLLSTANIDVKMEQLYTDRLSFYSKANYRLNSEEQTLDNFNKILQECLESQ